MAGVERYTLGPMVEAIFAVAENTKQQAGYAARVALSQVSCCCFDIVCGTEPT